MKKYIRLYRSSGSDPPLVIHDHVAEFYGLHDGDTVPHDLLPAVLDDCRKLNDMFYQIETAKKRGEAMLKTEQDTPEMKERVLNAAHEYFERFTGISAHFEHGQWWLFVDDYYPDDDKPGNFSVCDASGGDSIDGFCFEEL